ncbi:hypothetical protein [Shewanella frigidimarina]|uniref:hypothetical protein n=1 Tax=Shewanella frigidimarina TaxID=56812 RepID=UPI000F4F9692|nr:hypothetical protein [Shewanella frigidimarina]
MFVLTGINTRSINRRKTNEVVNSKQSERCPRLVRLATKLTGGEHKKAIQWLNKSAISLAVKRRFIGVFIAILAAVIIINRLCHVIVMLLHPTVHVDTYKLW